MGEWGFPEIWKSVGGNTGEFLAGSKRKALQEPENAREKRIVVVVDHEKCIVGCVLEDWGVGDSRESRVGKGGEGKWEFWRRPARGASKRGPAVIGDQV